MEYQYSEHAPFPYGLFFPLLHTQERGRTGQLQSSKSYFTTVITDYNFDRKVQIFRIFQTKRPKRTLIMLRMLCPNKVGRHTAPPFLQTAGLAGSR